MAKPDWGALQHQFLAEHAKTGISPKDWCAAQGLNYSSAKRYIKVTTYGANSQKKSAKKSANSQKADHAKRSVKPEPEAQKKTASECSMPPPSTSDDFGLSDQQMIFAQHVVDGKTRVDAYRLAGYAGTGNAAYVTASQLLRNPKVSRYVHHLRNERQKRYAAELDDVIGQLTAIINADPNEISQYRRVNCRYCWGSDHKYQWRDIAEQLSAERKAESDGAAPPDTSGGIGFVDNADPNPECPRCNGEGVGEPFFADTRDLEGDARYLLQGVKLGKFGIEILTADKDAARRELAKLLIARDGSGGGNNNDLSRKLIELEIRKRTAEAERIEQENAAKKAPGNPGEKPTIVINLVNSPDAE
ncbi:TPA: terminase small subunit [Klebsiella pneumoniae]|uniref:terminase small subunit n=1 Tax=Klebsiella TaxID=570 RepID=UPI0007CCE96A|nr:terminase small subunit [Klebsiella pneumoniae]OVT59094.1 terminase small subunit [Klebsiella pneumoniae]OVY37799.1 terminase small subunit [Klebsiella pneumoniae]SAU13182.1 terminase small subunit [Klebsiella pneumoniae]HBV5531503.1 terminase small subunit [Klebsiella pneumoniae]HBV5716100.1 terminase small subunit [Klebsiella pneumoniae]